LLAGVVLVIVVLVLFTGSQRAALVSVVAIPLSLLAAVAVLRAAGATLNVMVLGGLAIAVGEVVDDAIIDVENAWRRLRAAPAGGAGDRGQPRGPRRSARPHAAPPPRVPPRVPRDELRHAHDRGAWRRAGRVRARRGRDGAHAPRRPRRPLGRAGDRPLDALRGHLRARAERDDGPARARRGRGRRHRGAPRAHGRGRRLRLRSAAVPERAHRGAAG